MTKEQLREKRKQLRMTQAQLAEQLGVSTRTVERWETGRRKISKLVEMGTEYWEYYCQVDKQRARIEELEAKLKERGNEIQELRRRVDGRG